MKQSKGSKSLANQDCCMEDLPSVSVKHTKDVEVQTELRGTGFNFIMADNTTVLVYPPIHGVTFDTRGLFYPSNFIFHPHNIMSFPDPNQATKGL